MNLFKILASGDGVVNEPNISSFYAYLLDPSEGHGLGTRVLQDLLDPLIAIAKNKDDYNELKNLNNLIKGKERYDVWVYTEISVDLARSDVTSQEDKSRHIDILVEIQDSNHEVKYAFCIENKIRNTSGQPGQLKEEMEGLRRYYEKKKQDSENSSITPTKTGELQNPKFGLIYITPDLSDATNNTIFSDDTKNMDAPYVHMTWSSKFSNLPDDSEKNKYIFYHLSDILEKEGKGLSEPIFDFTKHTIKAFLAFIDSDFKSLKEEKKEGLWAKMVYKDYDEFISKSNIPKNDKAVELRKEINDILVNDQEYKLIPNYSPTNFSYSFNKGIKMINTTNRMFAWLKIDGSDLKIEFAKDPKMNWNYFEKKLKDQFDGIRLVKKSDGKNFGVRISSIKEFNEIVRPLIKFIKGYLLNPN